MNSITYVGLDVHKATISVAVAEGRRGGEVRHLGVFPSRPDHIAKLKKGWTGAYRRWLACVRFDHPAQQVVSGSRAMPIPLNLHVFQQIIAVAERRKMVLNQLSH